MTCTMVSAFFGVEDQVGDERGAGSGRSDETGRSGRAETAVVVVVDDRDDLGGAPASVGQGSARGEWEEEERGSVPADQRDVVVDERDAGQPVGKLERSYRKLVDRWKNNL